MKIKTPVKQLVLRALFLVPLSGCTVNKQSKKITATSADWTYAVWGVNQPIGYALVIDNSFAWDPPLGDKLAPSLEQACGLIDKYSEPCSTIKVVGKDLSTRSEAVVTRPLTKPELSYLIAELGNFGWRFVSANEKEREAVLTRLTDEG